MEICENELVSSLADENSWFCVWCCAWFSDYNFFSGHFITSPLCRAVHDTLFEKRDGACQSHSKSLQCLACYETFPTQVAATHHFGLVRECQQKIHEYLRSFIGPKPFVETKKAGVSNTCFDSQLTNDGLMNVLLREEQTFDNKTNDIHSSGINDNVIKTDLNQYEIKGHKDGERLKPCKIGLDPEKRERKRIKDLERKRFIRNNLDESEKMKRRLIDSEKKRIMRANMDEVEKARRRQLEAERKRIQRANMDEGERARLRKLEAERQRMRRASMDKAQQIDRRRKNTEMNKFQQAINSI